ncbi:hypothetical protein GDO81_019932 [Engystomops pustulosus]|uniref:Uncharacterized protein n=1 Tax=Engystomops pustulosus TaxID=76066 RepID=A0AAV6Z259_ENGPU|nr:hypothetical protein GDO81_019932 [Engystomops pustulosus]
MEGQVSGQGLCLHDDGSPWDLAMLPDLCNDICVCHNLTTLCELQKGTWSSLHISATAKGNLRLSRVGEYKDVLVCADLFSGGQRVDVPVRVVKVLPLLKR